MKNNSRFTKRALPIVSASLLAAVALAVCTVVITRSHQGPRGEGKVIINDQVFAVELARTAQQHRFGLMFRTELPDRHGMLFIFDHPAIQRFWMKNTCIPLDIIFIDADGTIINIATLAAHSPRTARSERESLYVLELAGGSAERYNISPGMTVEFAITSAASG